MPTPEENSKPASYEDLKNTDPYKEDLKNLTKEIEDLKDKDKNNDAIGEAVILNNQLNDTLKDYLLRDKNVTNLIEEELNRIKNDPKISPDAKNSADSLLKLIKSIHTPEQKPDGTEVKEQPQNPKLDLQGELGDIAVLPDGKNTKGKFYSKLIENKPENASPEQKNDRLSLRGVKEHLSNQGSKINELLASKQNLINDEDFKKAKDLLEGIQKVINNPEESNVIKLQEFISKNLEENSEAKIDFDKASKSEDGNFDGKFGVGTLAGLRKVLEKTGKYIDEVSAKFDKPDVHEVIPESLKGVELKENPIKIKKDGEIKPEEWLKGLPGGAKVSIKEGNPEMTKTSSQKLTLLVELGEDKRKIPVEVIVVENLDSDDSQGKSQGKSQETTSQKPQETTPLQDNDGKKHLVMGNSNELANRCGLENAVFYSSLADQNETTKEVDGDKEYLMKMGENVYKVKLDSAGKLCPLAENNNSGVKVIFKDIPSCKQYLQNKIPSGVNARIGWSNNKQDYILISDKYKKALTIEPMTMDGKWVSKNLSECLALINFANFLRGAGEIDDVKFKNNNPDIKFDDGKLYIRVNKKEKWGENGKGGKWYPVPMDKFGLNGVGEDVINNFIKYNNGEHWEDNWDKKGDNKGYKKIDLTVGSISTGVATSEAGTSTGTTSAEAGTSTGVVTSETRASTGITSAETGTSTGVVASEVGTSAGTTSAEAGTSTGVLKDVIVTGSVLRPKNPINFGPENEQINENKTGKLEGIGAFDGNGNFIFDKDIQENTQGDKNTIKIGDDEFTKISYEKEKGISIQGFSGKGYQVGNTGEMKRFFVGEYNDETKKGTGKRIFENGACYEGEWSEGLEDGKGKYTYSNGDTYEGDFKEGNLDGNGIYMWKNGCSFKGEFKDNEMTKGLVVLKLKGGKIMLFDVENDGKGLKIISDNVDGTKGKYVDIKKGDVVDSLGNQPSDVVSKGADGGLDNNKDGAESESNFVDEGNKRTWKNGNKFEGEIKDGKIIKGIFFISDGGSNGVCQVERDEKGLKIISEGPNANKYIDENTGEIKDINEAPVPVSSESRIDFANAAMAKDLGIDFNMPNKFEYDGISIDVVDEYSIKSGKGDEIIYFSDPETEDIQKDIATLIAISKCLKGANKVEIKDENTLTVTKQGGQQEFNIKNMGLVDNGGTLLNKIEDVCSWMNNYIKKHPDTINEPGNVTTQNSVGETNPNTRDDQVYESTSYSWKQPKRDSDA